MGTTPSKPKFGHHVLQVEEGSPAAETNLTSFFDFIVAANGIVLDRDDSRLFVGILQQNVGQEVSLLVYNSKDHSTREVKVVPSDSWGGSGLLGVRIRFCALEGADENVWHVLEVFPRSPAASAGLQAFADYIVGTNDLLFSDSEDFFTLVQANMGTPTPLYVYNILTDAIRQVVITPNQEWGGTGSLGCNVGYGYLHRIPQNRKEALADLDKLNLYHGIEKGEPEIAAFLQAPDVKLGSNREEATPGISAEIGTDGYLDDLMEPVASPLLPARDMTTISANSSAEPSPHSSPAVPRASSLHDLRPLPFDDSLTRHGSRSRVASPHSAVMTSSPHRPTYNSGYLSSSGYISDSGYSSSGAPMAPTLAAYGQPTESFEGIPIANIKFPEDHS